MVFIAQSEAVDTAEDTDAAVADAEDAEEAALVAKEKEKAAEKERLAKASTNNEEVEHIDELNRDTLKSYINKAKPELKAAQAERTDARMAGDYKTQCDDAAKSRLNSMAISYKTMLFKNYEEQIPRNKNGISASIELNKIAQGLRERYNSGVTTSPAFCKLKFEGIEHSADLIQHVLGNRPR